MILETAVLNVIPEKLQAFRQPQQIISSMPDYMKAQQTLAISYKKILKL
jgi:hypothetical protein